jgi:hypothetical protein
MHVRVVQEEYEEVRDLKNIVWVHKETKRALQRMGYAHMHELHEYPENWKGGDPWQYHQAEGAEYKPKASPGQVGGGI